MLRVAAIIFSLLASLVSTLAHADNVALPTPTHLSQWG
jgi:hypothetical protein